MISGFNTRAYGGGSRSGSGKNSGTQTPVNAWANGGASPTPAQAAMVAVNDALGGEEVEGSEFGFGKKKGKGKGKAKKGETLFHFG